MPFDNDCGKKPGIEAWRIEKMEPVRVESKSIGSFYSGDCYIVLHTIQREKSSSYDWDLFFWLGKDSSQDEQGAVAYHTVALDDHFGGKPVQYREVQGFESTKFMALFPKGVTYKDGGMASAFKHVDRDHYEPRLFQLKGKRNVRVSQVPLKTDSLNDGDVFILDLGLNLYQWNGKEANKYEKMKGLEVSTKIRNEERGGKAELHVLDSGKNDQSGAESEAFWKALGGHGKVKSADEGGSDDVKEQRMLVLQRVDDNGAFEKVAENKLEKSMLDSNGIFVVCNGSEVFVWCGKSSDKDRRKKVMQYGVEFLKANNLPANTPVARINETGETPSFKAQFALWDAPRILSVEEAKVAQPKEADASSLYAARKKQEEEKMATTEGKTEVWRIENMAKAALPKDQYGQFFSGDSYIVLFSYKVNSKDKYLIYFWQGRDSSNDEKGASALLTKQMDDELRGEATQVRVVQGKEPNHFLALFKGRMVVHSGGHASAFKNRKETDTYDIEGNGLYHVRGTSAINTRASAVAPQPSSLNSGDCFILLVPGEAFVWYGVGSNDDEKSHALSIAKILKQNRQLHEVNEESESDSFWNGLGGKGEYPKTKTLETAAHEPRLFQCVITNGFKVDEVFNFTQDDLTQDDVMLLDTFDEVFVWIGHDANRSKKESALKVALDYVKNAPDGRSVDTPVFKVEAGCEPPNFTCHFLGWNDAKASDFSDPYLAKLGQVAHKSEHKSPTAAVRVTADDIGFKKGVTYSLAEIKSGAHADVDPSHKEQYLNDQEFHDVFKMSKAEFAAMPAWKQANKKKETGLF